MKHVCTSVTQEESKTFYFPFTWHHAVCMHVSMYGMCKSLSSSPPAKNTSLPLYMTSCYMHACLYVRKCEITDIVQFSLVNVTATCTYVMLFCAAWANGEPLRILYPTDSMGRLCGSHSAVRWVALHLINGEKWMDGWLCMWSNWPKRITCPKLALLVIGFIPLLHLETGLIFFSLTSPNVPRL